VCYKQQLKPANILKKSQVFNRLLINIYKFILNYVILKAMKTPIQLIKKIVFTLVFALMCHLTYSQCLGPVNNGDPFSLDVTGGDVSQDFNVGGIVVTISYERATGKINIDASDGTLIHTNGAGLVENLADAVDVSPLANFEPGPVCMFDLVANTGPFGGGNDGYIAIRNGDNYGWIYLTLCGFTDCFDYRFAIEERRADAFTPSSVFTGDCDSAPIQIPTLSQWGIICLSLLCMIFGLIAIRKRSFHLA
jgi:hypothetical protein